MGGFPLVPANMISSMDFPRSCFTLCSPMAHLRASTILLLPQPLGPTIPEIPEGNSIEDFSTKDLNPVISIFFSFMCEKIPGSFRF